MMHAPPPPTTPLLLNSSNAYPVAASCPPHPLPTPPIRPGPDARRLSKVSAPSLFLVGDRDRMCPPEGCRATWQVRGRVGGAQAAEGRQGQVWAMTTMPCRHSAVAGCQLLNRCPLVTCCDTTADLINTYPASRQGGVLTHWPRLSAGPGSTVMPNIHVLPAPMCCVPQMFGSPSKRFVCLGPSAGFSSHYGKGDRGSKSRPGVAPWAAGSPHVLCCSSIVRGAVSICVVARVIVHALAWQQPTMQSDRTRDVSVLHKGCLCSSSIHGPAAVSVGCGLRAL